MLQAFTQLLIRVRASPSKRAQHCVCATSRGLAMEKDEISENQELDPDAMIEQESGLLLSHLGRTIIMISLEAERLAVVRACNATERSPRADCC